MLLKDVLTLSSKIQLTLKNVNSAPSTGHFDKLPHIKFAFNYTKNVLV